MADEEYVSFENALRDLQITADQLKRLVSEGEIRAIRGEHNTMRFRKDEIDRLKQDTGKTLQFTEASSETLTDDLLFDEADDKDAEEGASTVQMKPSAAAAEGRAQAAAEAGRGQGRAGRRVPRRRSRRPSRGRSRRSAARRHARRGREGPSSPIRAGSAWARSSRSSLALSSCSSRPSCFSTSPRQGDVASPRASPRWRRRRSSRAAEIRIRGGPLGRPPVRVRFGWAVLRWEGL